MKQTKIVASISDRRCDVDFIRKLFDAGMNVVRMNTAHATPDGIKTIIRNTRAVSKHIGILIDTKGPEVRTTGNESPISYKTGDVVKIFGRPEMDTEHDIVNLSYENFANDVHVGDDILFDDGAIDMKVIGINGPAVIAQVQNDGKLGSHKSVNVPGVHIDLPALTEKDKANILLAIEQDIDFIAHSFVRSKADVMAVQKILDEHNSDIKIISKIENQEGVDNIDEIIEASYGIMIARGDLGIEVPYYKVPTIQKLIIKKANAANRPVITATQMMLSMAKSQSATRAEISDVANAVLDGTDAVMLSEESAVGINPVAVVKSMSATIVQSELIYPYGKFDEFEFADETDMVASASSHLAQRIGANAIISITSSGSSAIKMARNRPTMPIIAVTHDESVARSLTIVWGVTPSLVVPQNQLNLLLANTIKGLKDANLISDEATYTLTAGYPAGKIGSTNYIRILRKEQIKYYLNEVK